MGRGEYCAVDRCNVCWTDFPYHRPGRHPTPRLGPEVSSLVYFTRPRSIDHGRDTSSCALVLDRRHSLPRSCPSGGGYHFDHLPRLRLAPMHLLRHYRHRLRAPYHHLYSRTIARFLHGERERPSGHLQERHLPVRARRARGLQRNLPYFGWRWSHLHERLRRR